MQSESQTSIVTSSSASDDPSSNEKTTVVPNHVKRLSDPANGDAKVQDGTAKDGSAENKAQSAKKKGKGWYD